MSHFTVAVVTKDKNKLEELLAPYDENMMVEPYIDETKEELIAKAKKRKERFEKEVLEGKTIGDWQKSYLEAKNDEDLYKLEIYEDDDYDENGNHLTTYNPDSKWDWYSIGGRWRNTLLTKIDNEDVIQERSFADLINKGANLTKESPEGFKWVDGAKIKDICFDKMMEGVYEKSLRFWELKVEEKEPVNDEEKEQLKWDWYKKEYYTERYGTKEHYAEIQSIFHTFAMVDENGWNEKGKMGWWACDDSTKESEELYVEKFKEMLNDPANQDKYMIIVDCHI